MKSSGWKKTESDFLRKDTDSVHIRTRGKRECLAGRSSMGVRGLKKRKSRVAVSEEQRKRRNTIKK